MKIVVKEGSAERTAVEALVIGITQDAGKHRRPAVAKLAEVQAFDGRPNQTSSFFTQGRLPAKRVLLVGLGKAEEVTLERVRQAAGMAAKAARQLGIKRLAIELPVEAERRFSKSDQAAAIAEAVVLATYRFKRYKSPDPNEKPELQELAILVREKMSLATASKAVRAAQIVAESTCLARDLANLPSNDAYPEKIAAMVRKEARRVGLRCRVFDHRQIERMGMGGVVAVGQGSVHPPRFVVLEHRKGGPKRPTLALIGKGITFDSGGISIKPGEKMDQMKYDKSGGCAVIGALRAAALLRLPVNVIGIIAFCENLPSGTAYRPGDIIRMYSGKTVEVLNTDAEGRMTLADALAYARRQYKPAAVVDLATLTGACVVALGNAAMGLFSNDQPLADRVARAGEATWERTWRLPVWEDYHERIKSEVADIRQIGDRSGAGAITAACFLQKFVDGTPWVHLDIAGTAWADDERPYVPRGATGSGVRLLVRLLHEWGR